MRNVAFGFGIVFYGILLLVLLREQPKKQKGFIELMRAFPRWNPENQPPPGQGSMIPGLIAMLLFYLILSLPFMAALGWTNERG